MKNTLSINFLILSCAVSAMGQMAVGTLQGVVTDVEGVPLPAAQVEYQRIFRTVNGSNGQPVPAPGEAVVEGKTSVDLSAAFLVPGLPQGDYLLCASVPSAAYLDPCQWATPLRVTVSPNAVTTQNIALAKGVFLKVRVNDPMGLLPQTLDGPMGGGKLAVGVYYANGAYAGVPNTEVDGSGRDYQRIIPAGVPLNLWLFSSDVALANANGKPVDNSSGALIPFQATAGQDQVFTFAVSGAAATSLKPVIFRGGVVNAASYQAANTSSQVGVSIQSGSIVSIFGTNLAASTETATTVRLPTQLGGTTVTAFGVAVHLFYVSPDQINFQMPSSGIAANPPLGIVVTTAAGASDFYLLGQSDASAFGIFTLDSSGCGQGAVLNVKADGSVSVNSPSDSVSPGDYISVYGTGLYVDPAPPDGTPTPASPLTTSAVGAPLLLDFAEKSVLWAGLAPGLVGVEQINAQVPSTVREGCAVPLQVVPTSISQPVTISVRKGGGPCVDPPSAGYGQITWEKTITTAPSSSSETDTITVSLQASPGKQAPLPPAYTDGISVYEDYYTRFGPSCPVAGYRSLGAGAVTAQGPGFGAMQASVMPLQEGQVSGLTVYQAMLPAGGIQPGSFGVSAASGPDVGAFQSSVQIGKGIQVTTPLSGRVFPRNQPLTVNWTGGDPNTWVTFTVLRHDGYLDEYYFMQAHTSKGTFTVPTEQPVGWLPGPLGAVEIILEVTPDPSQIPAFSAPGLSLGGQHTWKYTYRFEGVTIQ